MSENDYDGGDPFTDFSTAEDGSIDYTLPLGKVRLLILDDAPVVEERLFSDPQLDAFLELNNGSVLRTAAQALIVIAMSENLMGKKLRFQDAQTDGPAVAAELRAQAKVLVLQADAEDALAEEGYFEIIPGSSCSPEAAERYVW